MTSLQRNSDVSRNVGYVVNAPTLVAYGLAMVHYKWTAVAIVVFFLWAAVLQLHLFHTFKRWPTISKLAVLLAPALIALGFFLPIDAIGWWVMAPAVSFGIIAYVGRVALRRANIER